MAQRLIVEGNDAIAPDNAGTGYLEHFLAGLAPAENALWIYATKAVIEAEEFKYRPYDRQKLEQLYDRIHLYTANDNGINQFIQALAEAGVTLYKDDVLLHIHRQYQF